MSRASADLCVVVPAYQERQRLPLMLEHLAHFCKTAMIDVEVIVVDDGSTDGTSEIAAEWRSEIARLEIIRFDENAGKGAAVRTGMLATSARWRALLDADASVLPSELEMLMAVESPVVIGSVAVDHSLVDPQPWYRVALGKAGNRAIQALVLPGIADSQRGCKLFRGDVAESVFSRCVIDRWGFDVEVLAIARSLGYEPVEIGVRWQHQPGGTLRPTDYLRTLVEVVRVRLRTGRHRPVAVPNT